MGKFSYNAGMETRGTGNIGVGTLGRLALVLVVWIAVSGFWLVGLESEKAVDLGALDSYFEQARVDWKIPGMAVAIVKDGEIVLAKGYGLREYGKDAAVNDKTLFAIASNSKAFTAATIALLVEEGKLSWDDKVRKHLPYFKLYDPYVTEEMTVRDLLCHRSGLRTFSGDLLWYETNYSTEEVIRRARFLKPAYGFRTTFGYSNIMFMTAGEIVSKVSGESWGDFLTERIFTPLGMKDSNIGTKALEGLDNVATPHSVLPDGRTVTVPYTNSIQIGSAGAINSSVRDMAQWLKMQLALGEYDGKRILSEKNIWEMWSMHTILKVSRGSKRFFPSKNFGGYGLGWQLFDHHGHKVVNHGGGLDGMISHVAMAPDMNLGMVILTNSINGLPSALMYKILDSYVGIDGEDWSARYLERFKQRQQPPADKSKKAKQKRKQRHKKTRENLQEFAGAYTCQMYGGATVKVENGKLVLDFVPSPVFTSDLTYWQHDTFNLKLRRIFSFIPEGVGKVQFLRDMDGNVASMKVDIPNHDFWFWELDFKKDKKKK